MILDALAFSMLWHCMLSLKRLPALWKPQSGPLTKFCHNDISTRKDELNIEELEEAGQ